MTAGPDARAAGDEARYERARRKVRKLKLFYVHVVVYCAANAALAVINLLAYSGTVWFMWPIFGWGMALAVHGVLATERLPFLSREWEARKIRDLMDREEGG